MTSEQGNKLIAAFMGLERRDHQSYATWHKPNERTGIFESGLRYDRSWEDLMLVVEAIEKIEGVRVKIEKEGCLIDCDFTYWINVWIRRETKMKAVFETIVLFIKAKNEYENAIRFNSEVWSERAYCHKVVQRDGYTFLHYECLNTGRKTKITHNEILSRLDYEGRTIRLTNKHIENEQKN